ncbi:MAG TPA: spore germination protein [Acetivibrio sp.]|nr:spore germination protein [Acetivibrio sp.]
MFFKRRKKVYKTDKEIFTEKMEKSENELTSSNISNLIQHSADIIFHSVNINGNKNLRVTVIFIEGLVDIMGMDQFILKPIMQEMDFEKCSIEDVVGMLEHSTLFHGVQKIRTKLSECVNDIMDGSVALVFDKVKKAVTFDMKGFDRRSITEPTEENVLKGPKDAFIEVLRTNTATIRRKIKTHNLVIEETTVGKQTLTKVAIVYIKGITNRHIIEEVKKRLDNIKADGVISSGVIEEEIIDNKYSPFPQIMTTERPDRFCASVLEGRVGIIIEGLPTTFVAPGTLNQFLQGPKDYSQNFIASSVFRLMRFTLMVVTLLLPGFYIAITSFHHEMIPTELALSITASKEGVPFPGFIEVIFMLIAFEALVEAGLRLPKNISQAVTIVGALVVGQAAVEAKLVSPAVVVIISMTAVASFTMPDQDFSNALRIWRFVIVILSSVAGLYGLSIGSLLLLIHWSKMESFGVPYLAPFVSVDDKQLQDTLFRLPFSSMYKRPIYLKTTDKKRRE